MQNANYADPGAEAVLRALGELLGDPKWRDDALEQIALLLDRTKVPDKLSKKDRDELIADMLSGALCEVALSCVRSLASLPGCGHL